MCLQGTVSRFCIESRWLDIRWMRYGSSSTDDAVNDEHHLLMTVAGGEVGDNDT